MKFLYLRFWLCGFCSISPRFLSICEKFHCNKRKTIKCKVTATLFWKQQMLVIDIMTLMVWNIELFPTSNGTSASYRNKVLMVNWQQCYSQD